MDTNDIYDAATAVRYDAAVPISTGEVEFYLELAREAQSKGLRTLEPTCGTGRIAIPLAHEGIRIVGLDASPDMLARARAKSAGLENVEWVDGDARSFDLGEEFGFVYIPAGTLHLMLTVEDQMACLRCVHRHLAPGGRFAFVLDNFGITEAAGWLTERRGVLVRNPARDFVHPETGRRCLSWGTNEIHPSTQRRIGTGVREELNAQDEVVVRAYSSMETRYFYRYEVEHLLARCGFEVAAFYGDYLKSEYRGTSPGMVWVARRSQ